MILLSLQQVLVARFPLAGGMSVDAGLDGWCPPCLLFAFYLLFYILTPTRYRARLPQMAGRVGSRLVAGDGRACPLLLGLFGGTA